MGRKEIDVLGLTQSLIAIDSVSRRSNAAISTLLAETLQTHGFVVEWLDFQDENREQKVSLVAKKGAGDGGLAFFSHSDTVPGEAWTRDPYQPILDGGRLIGLGSCDMKGPLAATIGAAATFAEETLQKPVYVVITADEEISGLGAKQIAEQSTLFQVSPPEFGIIAEPTQLIPVYAHKGGARVIVTAHGRAAHTSTDEGISANLLIAPFLAEVAEEAKRWKMDSAYMNFEFSPPTNGFNMVLNDGDCKPNVTAARTVCTLSFRPMPNDHSEEIIGTLTAKATAYGFAVTSSLTPPFYIAPDSEIVQLASRATDGTPPGTVAFGTDSVTFRHYLPLVILGPGNIAQAHTVDEWIDMAQLLRAQIVYRTLIESICVM